jgi:hypothetical protein
MIGRTISEAAIASSFDIWRRYMGGKPQPGAGGEREAGNRENMLPATGKPIADEEIRPDEDRQSIMKLCEEIDCGDLGREERGDYEIVEADDENWRGGALGQLEPPLPSHVQISFLRQNQNQARKIYVDPSSPMNQN